MLAKRFFLSTALTTTAIGKRASLLLASLGLTACVSSQIEQLQHQPMQALEQGETVVVLGRRQNFRHQTEADFTDCVYKTLLRRQGLPVKPEEQFMDQMFPWFQPRTAPLSADALAERLEDPALAERLRAIGTRYIIWLDGVTQRKGDGGNMSCTVGAGFGGCFGLMWWENDASYTASIWDMQRFEDMGKIAVGASGTSYVPAMIVPIPLIAPTEAAACKGVARQLQEFIQTAPN